MDQNTETTAGKKAKMTGAIVFLSLFCTCLGNTGSSVQLSQKSNLVPLDIITELQALTLELQKDFNRVTKDNAKILQENKALAAEVATLRRNVSRLQSESDVTSLVQPGGYFLYVAQIPEAASFNVYLHQKANCIDELHR